MKKIYQQTLLASLMLMLFSPAFAESVLRRGNGSEPQTLDPQIAEGVPSSNIQRDLFEGLISEDEAGNLVPGLAKSWDVSEDGKVYTFHLREENWTDGTPITAEDAAYALKRLVNPNLGSAYSFVAYPIVNAEAITEGKIKSVDELGVKVIDDHTLEITLNAPTPYFLGLLTHASTFPVPKKVVEKHGKNWTRPENIVSNGPFKMDSWKPNSHLTLVKSEHYWDKDTVKLDKVVYYPIEDQNAELKRYRAGELDWTYEIPNDQLKWIRENLNSELKIAPYLGLYYYGFNQTKAPFKDNLPLRKALSLAIDRKILTEKVVAVGEQPAYNIMPPNVLNYHETYQPAESKWDRAKQIEEAKKLYAEAGYSKDKPLKIELTYNTSENHKKIAVAVAAMWKQVLGVQTSLDNKEWKVFLSERRQKNPMLFRAGWIGDYNDPNTFLELFYSNSGLNDVGFNKAEFDNVMKEASQEADLKKRAELLKQAEQLVVDDYAIIPIYHYVTKHMVKPYVKGYTLNVMDHNGSKYMYIEK